MIKKDVFDSAETVIGVVLLVVLIIGSVLLLILALPKEENAKKMAKPMPEIDRFFFADENYVSGKINQLRVPAGVPVEVDNNNLGRGSIFDKF